MKSDELSVRWKPSENAETFDVRSYSVQYRAYGEETYSEHTHTATTKTKDYSYTPTGLSLSNLRLFT